MSSLYNQINYQIIPILGNPTKSPDQTLILIQYKPKKLPRPLPVSKLYKHILFSLPPHSPTVIHQSKAFWQNIFYFWINFWWKTPAQHLTSGQTLAIVRPISTSTNTTMRDYSRRVTYNDRALRGTARTGIIQPIIVVKVLILSLVAQAVPSFGARGRASLGPDKLGAEL